MRRRAKERQKEKKKQSADFRVAACCPSAVVQRAALQKNGLCDGSALDVLHVGGFLLNFFKNLNLIVSRVSPTL